MFHWPCATTLLTVKKETGSLKWTLLSAVLPLAFGVVLCLLISGISKIFV
jgi:ferrous iron transport protein B